MIHESARDKLKLEITVVTHTKPHLVYCLWVVLVLPFNA
jgi:hypothetical protein